jgi:peptidoglycan/LPS O-acetylase OafA/YrhL
VSILVWRWIDRPLNRRRRAWVDGRMGAADGASQPATKRDDSAPVFA